jgi:hypothetical protein
MATQPGRRLDPTAGDPRPDPTPPQVGTVGAAVSGSPPPSQTRGSLLPGLPRSTGFAPTWSPHAWRARSWCPRSPATSPAGRARRAGRAPRGGAGRTRRRLPTRPGGASTSPVTRSQARGRAVAARESRCGPCTRSRRSRPGRESYGAGRRRAAAAVRDMLTALQTLPRDAELLAFEAGCEDYCEREVDDYLEPWKGLPSRAPRRA